MATLAAPLGVGTTDEALVAAARAGDDRAFEQLYGRYRGCIRAYVQGRVQDHGRSEDITQEVFMSALRRMRKTDSPINFKPWIYEIAKNACIDAFRRRTDEVPLSDHLTLVSATPTPEAAVDTRIALENLQGAFGGLSEAHHDILVMRELEGRSYREIGDRLGMGRSSVESTLFRARRRLREEWEKVAAVLPLPAFLRSHWVSFGAQHAEPMSSWAKAATLAATVALASTGAGVVTSQGDSTPVVREVPEREYASAPTKAIKDRQSTTKNEPAPTNRLSRGLNATTTVSSARTMSGTVQSSATVARASTPNDQSSDGPSAKSSNGSAPSSEISKSSDGTPSATTEADKTTTPRSSDEAKPVAPTTTTDATGDTSDDRDGRVLARILARRRAARQDPPAVPEAAPEVAVPAPSVEVPSVADTTSTVTETAPRRPVLNAVSKIIAGGTSRPMRNAAPVDSTVDTPPAPPSGLVE